jgi:hypothetical protein
MLSLLLTRIVGNWIVAELLLWEFEEANTLYDQSAVFLNIKAGDSSEGLIYVIRVVRIVLSLGQ